MGKFIRRTFRARLVAAREEGNAPRDRVFLRGRPCAMRKVFRLNMITGEPGGGWSTLVWRIRVSRIGQFRKTDRAIARERRASGWREVMSAPRRAWWAARDPKSADYYANPMWAKRAAFYFRTMRTDLKVNR